MQFYNPNSHHFATPRSSSSSTISNGTRNSPMNTKGLQAGPEHPPVNPHRPWRRRSSPVRPVHPPMVAPTIRSGHSFSGPGTENTRHADEAYEGQFSSAGELIELFESRAGSNPSFLRRRSSPYRIPEVSGKNGAGTPYSDGSSDDIAYHVAVNSTGVETYASHVTPADFQQWRQALAEVGGNVSRRPPPSPMTSSVGGNSQGEAGGTLTRPRNGLDSIYRTLTPPSNMAGLTRSFSGGPSDVSPAFSGPDQPSIQRSFRSNDNLVRATTSESPGRLALSGGIHSLSPSKVVLRPFVFRPVKPASSSPGFASANHNTGASDTPSGPSPMNGGQAVTKPTAVYQQTPVSRMQSTRSGDSSGYHSSGTPPSNGIQALHSSHPQLMAPTAARTRQAEDSTAELAALLRRREAEVHSLRATMERNETAMARTFEERRSELERQLCIERQHAAQVEAALTMASRRATAAESTASECSRDLERRHSDLATVHKQVGEAQRDLDARDARCRELEAALAEAGEALDAATAELARRRYCLTGEQRMQAATQTDPSSNTKRFGCETCSRLKTEVSSLSGKLSDERAQWLSEKAKVITYQRQLQLNYLQLGKKAERLESEVQQLTLELERKEHLLSGRNSRGSAVHTTPTIDSSRQRVETLKFDPEETPC